MKKNGLPGLVIIVIAALVLITAYRIMRPSGGHITPAAFITPTTFAEASAASAADGRPVLAFVTADWCGPCQSFKSGTLANPAITELLLAKSHPVLIDVTSDNPEAAPLKVFSIPTMLVFKDGHEVARLEGGANVSKLRSWFEAATKTN